MKKEQALAEIIIIHELKMDVVFIIACCRTRKGAAESDLMEEKRREEWMEERMRRKKKTEHAKDLKSLIISCSLLFFNLTPNSIKKLRS
jgi:hypothetical protein